MSEEVWRPISWASGYDVSSFGRVRSFWRKISIGYTLDRSGLYVPKIIKIKHDKDGYAYVILVYGKDRLPSGRLRSRTIKLPHLVLEEFGYKRNGRGTACQVRHLNGIKTDNRLSNIVWGTSLENAMDRMVHGTQHKGEQIHASRFTETQVLSILKRLSSGAGVTALSKELGVSRGTIEDIRSNKTWKHIPRINPHSEGGHS